MTAGRDVIAQIASKVVSKITEIVAWHEGRVVEVDHAVALDADHSKPLPFIKHDARANILAYRLDETIEGGWSTGSW